MSVRCNGHVYFHRFFHRNINTAFWTRIVGKHIGWVCCEYSFHYKDNYLWLETFLLAGIENAVRVRSKRWL